MILALEPFESATAFLGYIIGLCAKRKVYDTSPQGEIFKDYEALNGHATLKLYKRKFLGQPWSLIADLETDEAGIEYGSYQEYSPMTSGDDRPPTFEDLYLKQIKLQ